MLDLVRVRALSALNLSPTCRLSCGIGLGDDSHVIFGTTEGSLILIGIEDGEIARCDVGGHVNEVGVAKAGDDPVIVVRAEGRGVVAASVVENSSIEPISNFETRVDTIAGGKVDLISCPAPKNVGPGTPNAGLFAIAIGRRIGLMLLHDGRRVELGGSVHIPERVGRLAFNGKSMVASGRRKHYFVRVGRDQSLAVVTAIPRRAPQGMKALEEGKPAIFAALQGLFWKRPESEKAFSPPPAVPLGNERWLVDVQNGIEPYSSFGRRLVEEDLVLLVDSSSTSDQPGGMVRSSSMLSIMSARTDFTVRSTSGEDKRLPLDIVTAPPLLFCMLSKGELVIYSINEPSNPLQVLKLDEEYKNTRLLALVGNLRVAFGYQPNGRLILLEFKRNIKSFVHDLECEGDLTTALSLLDSSEAEKKIALLQTLAHRSRALRHHEYAIRYFERSLYPDSCTVETLGEAVKLRDQDDDNAWRTATDVSKLYADFLWGIRRQLDEPSLWDNAVLETLCASDSTAVRLKMLFSRKHGVSVEDGERELTSKNCRLLEEERTEALIALFRSFQMHNKVLCVWERRRGERAVEDVSDYLKMNIGQLLEADEFFAHVQWILQQGHSEEYDDIAEDLITSALPMVSPSASYFERTLLLFLESLPTRLERYIDHLVSLYGQCDEIESEGPIVEAESLASLSRNEVPSSSRRSCESFWNSLLSSTITVMSKRAKTASAAKPLPALRSVFDRLLYHPNAAYSPKIVLELIHEQESLFLKAEQAYLYAALHDYSTAAETIIQSKEADVFQVITRLAKRLRGKHKYAAVSHIIAAFFKTTTLSCSERTEVCDALVSKYGDYIDFNLLAENLAVNDGGHKPSVLEIRNIAATSMARASEKVKKSRMINALLKSEHQMVHEDLLERRRSRVVIGPDHTCRICTRRIGALSVFCVFRDGSYAHLACSRAD